MGYSLTPPLRILAIMPLRLGLTTVKEKSDTTLAGLVPAPDTPRVARSAQPWAK